MSTRASFDDYVSTRGPVLLRFAYLLCGDRQLAEDLVQDVLIRAHRRWHAIEADDPEAYVKRALVHAHVSWRRRRASGEVTIATPPDRALPRAFDDDHASRDELWALLATLPPTQRAVLVLRYFEDLDDNRIAELVGSSPGAVRVNAHRGLHRLRETLTARAHEAPTGTGLTANVRQGVQQQVRRRRAVVTGIAGALVLGVLAALIPLLRPTGNAPEPIGPSPSVSATSTLTLVPATRPADPDFPFAITWLPPGYGSPHAGVDEELGAIWAISEPAVGDSVLWITLRTDRWDWEWPADVEQTVAVNGGPAQLRTSKKSEYSGECIGLAWQMERQYLQIQICEGQLTVADVLRIAEGITVGSTPSAPWDSLIAAVRLPEGYVPETWNTSLVCASNAALDRVCVSVMVEPDPTPADGPALTIDGVPAIDATNGLRVYLPDGREVRVSFGPGSLADRIAIYRTVVLSPAASAG